MNKNILELIDKFQPQAVHTPIDKCKLEQTLIDLFDSMFPLCTRLDDNLVREKLKVSANTLFENIAKLTDETFANEVVEDFFGNFSNLRNRLFKDAQCYVKTIRQPNRLK